MTLHDPTQIPADLPVPSDDGAAMHLVRRPMPPLPLRSTGGELVKLTEVIGTRSRAVLFFYPRTGNPRPAAFPWLPPGNVGIDPRRAGVYATELLIP